MKKKSVIREKTLDFAIRIVNLFECLNYGRKEHVLSRQILKPGTSIGANVREAKMSNRRPILSIN